MSYQAPTQRYVKKRISEINVVPYIDVMLVLLVIFMVTTPLLNEAVNVDLPQAKARPLQNQEQEPVIVSVDRHGKYYMNLGENPRAAIDPQTLVARVAAILRHRPGVSVLVRGDDHVAYGQVVAVMGLLQQAGVDNVGLVTQPVARVVSE